jgi:uncharacterized protein YyaL (SSP411 family)
MNSSKHTFTNALIRESSPYLLQHAHNPVHWYPWGKEALEKAKTENKLILVSIGYAACHWCHVMEQESFEDTVVADFMNKYFIAIKVDREERPDIDQIYMNAVQLITGSGGWPLNCITLPDGRPIYGGTYFSKEQWLDMLGQLVKFVEENPEKAEIQAKSLTQGVQSNEKIYLKKEKETFSTTDLNSIFDHWKKNIDYTNGGNHGAPKFPLPIGYQFLLHYSYSTQNKDALNAVNITLQKMANGGIYDQIGGGFSRYSVDTYWKAPHFEKMLYDNAQLVSLYSNAYQQTKDPYYKTIVVETLNFIKNELTSKEGGFYASLDADSEGEEGKFYVWSKKELLEILGDQANLIIDYYHVSDHGNWEENKNILLKKESDLSFAKKHSITENELTNRIQKAKQLLFKERNKRIHPTLDDKILTAWNALMLKAYIDAYQALGNKEYLAAALKNAAFINSKLVESDNKLNRNFKNGKSSINAFLDDYAFTISAYIAIYQANFNEDWLNKAQDLTTYVIKHFYNKNTGMFYYTSDTDTALIARKTEVTDNVIPASNSEMAKNLFVLGHYFNNAEYIAFSEQMLNNIKQETIAGANYYANWDILLTWFIDPPFEVAIVGENYEALRKEISSFYLPNVFLLGGNSEDSLDLLKNKLIDGQTTIYVCKNKTCSLPVTSITDALKQIK